MSVTIITNKITVQMLPAGKRVSIVPVSLDKAEKLAALANGFAMNSDDFTEASQHLFLPEFRGVIYDPELVTNYLVVGANCFLATIDHDHRDESCL